MIDAIEKVLGRIVAGGGRHSGLVLTLLIGTEVFFRYIVGAGPFLAGGGGGDFFTAGLPSWESSS